MPALLNASVVQLLSGIPLENLAAAYLLAAEDFERVAQGVVNELGAHIPADTSLVDTTPLEATTGQALPAPIPIMSSPVIPSSSFPLAKSVEDRENRFTLQKTTVETRKMGRKLVRPHIAKPEEHQGNFEMSETEGFNHGGKPSSSHNIEIQGNLTLPNQPSTRKRPSPTSSELHEESFVPQETSSDVAAHLLKRSKVSDSTQDGVEGPTAACLETLEIQPTTSEFLEDIGDSPQCLKEEAMRAEKNEIESGREQSEEPKVDSNNEVELQNSENDCEEDLNKPSERVAVDDQSSGQAEQDSQQPTTESGSEREEGELVPDITDLEGGSSTLNIFGGQEVGEFQPEQVVTPVSSPGVDESVLPATMDIMGVNSPQALDDEKNDEGDIMEELAEGPDKFNDGNDQVAMEIDQVPEAALGSGDGTSSSTVVEVGVSKQGSPSVASAIEEVKQVSPVKLSTTINLQERAKQRAILRQAGVVSSSLGRGRGRAPRGRGGRSGRGGRGQTSGEQG
ncbi:unnamed protein product [Ilex paraguariensis]|uniref:Uncharacterized protein n=1 Tax=Ilex paraguariensis TaxID=185542 RepID=A0ABC8UF91_9AQUA